MNYLIEEIEKDLSCCIEEDFESLTHYELVDVVLSYRRKLRVLMPVIKLGYKQYEIEVKKLMIKSPEPAILEIDGKKYLITYKPRAALSGG